MVRVGKDSQYDLILESDDTASPTTTVGLKALRDEDGRPRWTERRVPPLPAQRLSGPIQYSSKDPRSDLVFSQTNFDHGALQAITSDVTSERYAKSDGLDMRGNGVVTLGMQRSNEKQLGFILRNPGAEAGTTTGWNTDTNITLSVQTTTVRSGSNAFKIIVDANPGNSIELAFQNLANPTAYQSREITVIAYAEEDATNPWNNDVQVGIEDSAGLTKSSASTTTGSFTFMTATRTIDASATFVRVGIYSSNGGQGTNNTCYFDDFAIIPTGGVVCNGVAELADAFYGIFGRCICQWDETNDVWDAVLIDSANEAKGIIEYNGNIYVSYSGDNAYVYGATTSWTASSIVGDARFAYFWAVAQGTLWKSRKDGGGDHNFVNSSINPINGGSWGTEVSIGSSDREITRLYSFHDTVIAGKEDGLHVYNRVVNDFSAADTWKNVTQEWEVFVDPENFSRGLDWHGRLYMLASLQSLFFLDRGDNLIDISSILTSPRLTDFGGRVRAFASDPIQLWLLVDTPTADSSITKETWLMSLRTVQGQFVLHTMEQVGVGDINILAANRGFLWALGRVNNTDASDFEAAIYRWTLPTKTVHPAFEPTPALNTTGNFDMARLDWGLPDEDKAFTKVTIVTKPNVLDQTGRSIVLKFGIDQAIPTTTTLATLTGSGAIQDAFFDTITAPETNAVGKDIQVNVTLNTNTSSDTLNPQLYAVIVHATLRPAKLKIFDTLVMIGDTLKGANVAKAKKLTDLATLEDQVYAIELTEDFANEGTENTTRVHIVPGTFQRVPAEEIYVGSGVEVYSLQLQETKLSS
jgi:hypothetical protein